QDADGAWPEDVVRPITKLAKARGDVDQARATAGVRWAGEDAHHGVLGQRAGRPTALGVGPEPGVGGVVVNVSGIEKRDQQVHVEESDQRPAYSSSRSRFTTSEVTSSSPSRGGNSGTPFRIRCFRSLGSSALRARSDRTRPAVVRRRTAISFAAWRTSPSMSRVVRTR